MQHLSEVEGFISCLCSADQWHQFFLLQLMVSGCLRCAIPGHAYPFSLHLLDIRPETWAAADQWFWFLFLLRVTVNIRRVSNHLPGLQSK